VKALISLPVFEVNSMVSPSSDLRRRARTNSVMPDGTVTLDASGRRPGPAWRIEFEINPPTSAGLRRAPTDRATQGVPSIEAVSPLNGRPSRRLGHGMTYAVALASTSDYERHIGTAMACGNREH
jgi:hypothetical protein